jgi:hypothetical protein
MIQYPASPWLELPDSHTCARGPLCEGASSPEAECQHDSCPQIYFAEFIGCPACNDAPYYAKCSAHGWREVVDNGTFTGYAGGRSSWIELSCGCSQLDESEDVRAAR